MRVLCTADLHVGRRPSRLPADADLAALSTAATWGRVVDLALAHRVDVVAVAGDLVDRANRFFEAIGPLEAGVRRLAAAGIPVVAVAGNHDHDVLPELAAGLPTGAFHLLGAGGRWERRTITTPGGRLHVDGWSFPAEHVAASPLPDHPGVPGDGVPVLGLLHADLDAPGSRYAPVTLAALRARPVDAWLLGHVHAPALHDDASGPPVLYPGAPQPMDPGEPGAHGVWIAELRPGARPRLTQHALATVRYDTCRVNVRDHADAATLRGRVTAAVRAHAAAVVDGDGPLAWLLLRVDVVGRTPLHSRVAACLAGLADDLAVTEGGVRVCVERVRVATVPAHDLRRLAAGHDAAAELARLVVALEGSAAGAPAVVGDASHDVVSDARTYVVNDVSNDVARDASCEALLAAARRRAAEVVDARLWQPLGSRAMPDDAALRRRLAARARDLLDALLADAGAGGARDAASDGAHGAMRDASGGGSSGMRSPLGDGTIAARPTEVGA